MINLSPLLRLFSQVTTFNNFADALHANQPTEAMQRPLGVLSAARPPLLAALQADLQRPMLFITARADRARLLTEQIQIWASDPTTIHRLPDPDALPFEKVPWGLETIRDRLAALTALILQRRHPTPNELPPLIITSARALMHPTMPPAEFPLQRLRVGERINITEVVAQWVDWGYQAEAMVEVPGTFSRRGGLLDIFPPNAPYPLRIDLFGDEIDSLRSFDPATQRSPEVDLARLSEILIAPATEALPCHAPEAMPQLQQLDLTTLQPSTKLNYEEEFEQLQRGEYFRGIEYYQPFFYRQNEQHPTSLFAYLPEDALVFVEDVSELALVVDELETQARSLKHNLQSVADLPADWPDTYFSWPTLSRMLSERRMFNLSFTGPKTTPAPELPYFQDCFTLTTAFGGQVKHVVEDLIKRKNNEGRIILISRQSKRLSNLLRELGDGLIIKPIESLTPDTPPPPSGSITLVNGVLMEGWALTEGKQELLTVVTDSEVFGWKKPTTLRHRKPRKGINPETFFADVNPGDFVVHIEHGIGRYVGLIKLTMDEITREYLTVEYARGDKLYVPIHQADRLARYVGVDENKPTLTRLGSADWNTVKRRAKKTIEDLAKDLLQLYAQREVVPGHAFNKDSEWQTELEDSFPYVETEDQLRAIAEVKRDMEQPKPMDRLVCGDVGYGKTEVALRAAFKAVMDGFQVAVLVPTTVLAQQHYQTFRDRLRNFPVQIGMLSRFRTRTQQEQTILNVAAGGVDIVIGTHRLIQKDIVFKKLGLLIIDEEQRFGVKDKERLKDLRASMNGNHTVDVLTLTATPIPRTLHMSLSGLRHLSIIDTPPEERLPIHTTVTEYDEALIRTAILRELDRGGQVFYVFNRVMGIEQKANRLRNIVPEARVAVGHGQMGERLLEHVMVDFVAGEFDILVSTTIIESGIDMPNVNTIIIDRADRMGLAQLYQLRGRVGRGAVQAYAYLLTPKHHQLKPEAQKRLEAIAEANELGAGFRIAMRDLEIRGAGELLGSRQHGQIAAVGFDLYTRLLAQTINELKEATGELTKGLSPQEETTAYLNPLADGIQINLPLAAYVPDDYLPEEKLRLRLYRRVAGLNGLDDIDDMAQELQDRFGDMPEPVANLLYQLKLKVLAREAGVKSITTESGSLVLRADTLEMIDRTGLARRVKSIDRVTPRQLWMGMGRDRELWQAEVEKVLRLIGRMVNDPGG